MTVDTDPRVKRAIAQQETLADARGNFPQHWQQIKDQFRSDGDDYTRAVTPGTKSRTGIYDSTGAQASGLLAAALHAALTNPSTTWFRLRAVDEGLNKRREVAVWLEAAQKILMAIFNSPKSRFANQAHSLYHDMADFGTASLYAIDRQDGRVPLFAGRPMSEIYLAEDANGEVNVVNRDFELTAGKAYGEYGAAAGAKVAEAATGDEPKAWARRYRFIHSIFERQERDKARGNLRNLPIGELVVNVTEKHLVKEAGYHEWPVVTPRWDKRADEAYGRGPGFAALPDARMLQRIARSTLRAAEKAINPPLMVADDGLLAAPRVGDNKITFVRADLMMRGDAIKALPHNARPDIGEDTSEAARERIRRAYLNHLLQISSDPRMTATQVIELTQQTMVVLNPIVTRQHGEFLQPIVARVLGIAYRSGWLPPLPASLEGQALRAEYESPIARQQRAADAKGVAQTLELTAPLGQIDPNVYDNLDTDLAFRGVADIVGTPKTMLRSTRDVEKIRAARRQAVEEEARRQASLEALTAAGQAAPALQPPAAANAA